MKRVSEVVARGAVAGAIGATALAIWFLAIDAAQGEPLRTPAFLARILLGVDTVELGGLGAVALYTLVHYAVFIGIGIAMAWVVGALSASPGFLLGVILGVLLFDLMFYASVVITGVDVVDALGWPEVLFGNVLAGVALVGYLHFTAGARRVSWRTMWREHRIIREGIVAGLLGATAVAVWFLVFDVARGQIFFTPAALGSAIFDGARGVAEVQITAPTVVGYTALHVTAFLLSGWIAAAFATEAEHHPPLILAFVLLFVTFEALFIGLLAIAAAWLLDALSWWSIALANLIAAGVVGGYLWREHPALRAELWAHGQELEEPAYRG